MIIDLSQPYLQRQLIAYLGNKRRLVPMLSDAFDMIEELHPVATMVDPFCGSGVVARLGKLRGYRVYANDWEPFAHVVTAAHVAIEPRERAGLFGRFGGIEALYRRLNSLPTGASGVFSRLYAPESTQEADYRTERLFYTRENAGFLDAVRCEIERLYPGWDLDPDARREKILLLSSLVYEASTHANTSGVFKGFHKGFGGHGKDALRRILAPMELELPVLCEGQRCLVGCEDAARFVSRFTADLCYLDPPYNQHQYGSNYHMLNTVVLGDEPPIENSDSKAGIRSDWVRTRSDFCYRRSALSAFERLLSAVDARFIVLSYNGEGTCDIDTLFELLERQGTVHLIAQEYVKYRGGRQSLRRRLHNHEVLLILDRARSLPATDRAGVRRAVTEREVLNLLKRPMHPGRVGRLFAVRDGRVQVGGDGNPERVPVAAVALAGYAAEWVDPRTLPGSDLDRLKRVLDICVCRDREEEVEVLLEVLSGDLPATLRPRAVTQLLNSLRKLAHRKYREEFETMRAKAFDAIKRCPDRYPGATVGLSRLDDLAQKRFEG